jgi:hypothetical protein
MFFYYKKDTHENYTICSNDDEKGKSGNYSWRHDSKEYNAGNGGVFCYA